MKTKDIIEQLQELDPSGELDVSVGLADISDISILPSYYDGYQQILIRHPEGYFPKGGRYNVDKDKIVIDSLSFKEAIYSDPEFSIDYSGLSEDRVKRYEESHEKEREDSYKITSEVDFQSLLKACCKKACNLNKSLDGLYDAVKLYFNEKYDKKTRWVIHPIFYLTWEAKFDLSGKYIFSKKSRSISEMQQTQWMHTLEVRYDEGWYIKEIEDKHYSKDIRDQAEKWWNENSKIK